MLVKKILFVASIVFVIGATAYDTVHTLKILEDLTQEGSVGEEEVSSSDKEVIDVDYVEIKEAGLIPG